MAQDAERRLLRFGKKAVERLMEVVSSDNPQVRFRAVYLLGKSGDPQAFPVILRFISDPDATVRYDAVMSLGYLGDPRAIPVLEEIAQRTEENPDAMGSAALSSLMRFGIGGDSEDE